MNYIISIDPGFGASGTAVSVFREETLIAQKIIRFQKTREAKTAEEKAYPFYKKIQDIIGVILWFAAQIGKNPGAAYRVVKEFNLMQGQAAEQHHLLEGALMYQFGAAYDRIHAMTVKKMITGQGSIKYPTVKKPTPEWPNGMPAKEKHKLEKARMALAIKDHLTEEEAKIITWDDEDSVDSVCIGKAYILKQGGKK